MEPLQAKKLPIRPLPLFLVAKQRKCSLSHHYFCIADLMASPERKRRKVDCNVHSLFEPVLHPSHDEAVGMSELGARGEEGLIAE